MVIGAPLLGAVGRATSLALMSEFPREICTAGQAKLVTAVISSHGSKSRPRGVVDRLEQASVASQARAAGRGRRECVVR
jgi:hypothetical protein